VSVTEMCRDCDDGDALTAPTSEATIRAFFENDGEASFTLDAAGTIARVQLS
jgi:hypothetical protein